uniref:Uncharacterized protein n=1 Tax=Xiphophorus couchianus TaxID=32473 RepID=A0A3B5MSR4_9TELE
IIFIILSCLYFSAGIKPGAANSGVTGPTSQIPGLCQTATESAEVERTSGRRVGIFETDSDYVKLAKQGGHKGLLSHDVDDDDAPKKAYNPPNWFGGDESKSQMKAGRRLLAAPFGTDSNSSWERETDSFSHGKEKMPLHLLLLPLFQFLSQLSFIFHLPPPVSMSKLLSHGYMEEKKKSGNDDDTSSTNIFIV